MGCEICSRSNCTRVFHSLDEQEQFDNINKTDEIKTRLKDIIERGANRLKTISNYGDDNDNEDYVKLSDVIDLIQSAD